MHCEGIIRIPLSIRPGSQVSCPHCSRQYELYDLMDQIPEVEVVNNDDVVSTPAEDFEIDTESSIAKEDGKFVVPPQLAAGIKKRRRRRRRSSESSSTSANAGPLTEAEENRQARKDERKQQKQVEFQQQRETAAPVVRRSRSGGSRLAAPKRNPVAEAMKIIIGGMLAAPVAYLLLLWVFSRDPLGLVPTINSVAPFLVPDHLILDEEDDKKTPPITTSAEDDEEDEFFKLPVPETDPDDIDPSNVDFNIETETLN